MESLHDAVKELPNPMICLSGLSDAESKNSFAQNFVKASDLPFEDAGEFSDAPFEFAETAGWLWENTRVLYYHANIENRYSENYLRLCGRLEKNIRNLGSYCLTKTVLEQKDYAFPEMDDLNILSLVKMVSYHLRKCHAAFQGCYHDNNFLGLSYLSWQFRWFELGNRLKATGVKIDRIKAGELKADSLMEQTEKYKGEPRTNNTPGNNDPKSLRINPSALPLNGSVAREILRIEKEQIRAEEKEQRSSERAHRSPGYYSAAPFGPPKPFPPEPYPLNKSILSHDTVPLTGPDDWDEEDDADYYEPETERELVPGELTPEEARNRLLKDAQERGDREALDAIPGEDILKLHERWERYCERVERAACITQQGRAGPDPGTRKKLREKRKKRKK